MAFLLTLKGGAAPAAARPAGRQGQALADARARGKLLQAALVLIVAALVFRYGIRPPMPFSVFSLYMAVTLMAVLVYVSSDSDSWRAFVAPLWAILTDPGRRPLRLALGVLIPLLVGYYAYSQASARPRRRSSSARSTPRRRTRSASAARRSTSSTPTRRSGRTSSRRPANREKHLAAGAAIYIRNCMYCHGDLLDGQGHFAARVQPAAGGLRRAEHDRPALRGVRVLAHRQGRSGPAQGVDALELGDAGLGGPSHRGADLAGGLLPLRDHGPSPPGHGLARGAADGAGPGGRASWPAAQPRSAPGAAAAQGGDVALGKQVYDIRCAGCHGVSGKGDGPAAELLVPRPRDFTAGKYKIRTVAGPLASDQDLLRIVTEGCPAPRCPPGGRLPERERSAVVAYIKTFAETYKDAKLEPVAATEGGRVLGGIDPAGQEDVRRLRVRQVPRPGRPGRPGAGVRPQGRLGPADPPGQPPPAVDFPGRPRAEGRGHAAPDRGGRDADARDRRLPRGLPEVRREGRGRAGREHLGPRQLRPLARPGPAGPGVRAADLSRDG